MRINALVATTTALAATLPPVLAGAQPLPPPSPSYGGQADTLTVPVPGGRGVLGTAIPALALGAARARRPLLSLTLGRSSFQQVTQTASYTYAMAFTLPADAQACRFAFANTTATPYTLPVLLFAPSSSLNDYVNPTGGGSWAYATANAGGSAASRDVYAPGTAAAAITVPGNAAYAPTGASNVPALFWTDWNTLATLPPASGPARVVMLRVGQGANTTITSGTFATSPAFQGNSAANGGWDFASLIKGGDYWTAAGTITAPGQNTLVPVAAVQCLTTQRGLVLLSGGDSHFAGDTTAGGINDFARQAVAQWNNSAGGGPGGVPATAANVSWGGQGSNTFGPALLNAIGQLRPSVVVLQGWTANDGASSLPVVQRYLARVQAAAQAAIEAGAVPVIVTPFPRDASFMANANVLANWLYARQAVLAMASSGAIVLDATAVLGAQSNGSFTGTYLPGMSSDNIHPNDAGHAAVAALLLPVIRLLAGP